MLARLFPETYETEREANITITIQRLHSSINDNPINDKKANTTITI